MDKIEIRETMSALADGHLQGEAFAKGLEFAARESEAREAWHTYHLIGDVLRSTELAGGTPPADFLGRLQARLRDEPRPEVRDAVAQVASVAPAPAANDGAFRWKLVAGVASVAAVAAIGWAMVAPGSGGVPPGPQLADVPAGTVLAGGERGVMIRDPRLDELMAAHRQLGGGSALQTPAGFLRNATFDASGR